MLIKLFYKIAKDIKDSNLSIELKEYSSGEEISKKIYSFSSEKNLDHAMSKIKDDLLSLNKSFIFYYYDDKNNYLELENLYSNKKIILSETNYFSDSNLNEVPKIIDIIK